MASSPQKTPATNTPKKDSKGISPTVTLTRLSSGDILPSPGKAHFDQLILPTQRVKMIMKSCPDVEQVSAEPLHLITRATELFIQSLVTEAFEISASKNRLEYEDLSKLVHQAKYLEFFRETIPKKISWSECQKLLEMNDVQQLEDYL